MNDLEELIKTLEQVTAAVNDASYREQRVADLVDHWLDQSGDESLSPAARATYLECAQAAVEVFR